jgi:putative spermidine/putrescine transport system ATP-binding protein
MSFLRLERLTKRFDSFIAVEDLCLSVEKGEFVSLLGPSGCGKTTTLQMIAGLHEPTAGQIFLEGQDITRKKPSQRGLGIVFQSYALFPHMSVFDNVSFGLEMRNVDKVERKERVLTVLNQVKLAEFAHRYPKELSGGQRQRVALARALVIEPPVLLLDEPLSNLDAKLREGMQLELRLLQQNLGVTTILVTHDQSEALSMSDRIVVMNEGRVVQIDTPVGMYETPADAFVSNFVGKTNLLEGVVEQAGESSATIKIGDVSIETLDNELAAGQSVFVSLRPEKLALGVRQASGGIPGTMSACIFHGDRWLYQISTQLGELIVTEPNAGHGNYRRGDDVHLTWSDGAMRILVKDTAHG